MEIKKKKKSSKKEPQITDTTEGNWESEGGSSMREDFLPEGNEKKDKKRE